MTNLSAESLEEAIERMSLEVVQLSARPKTLWVPSIYLKHALKILGLIKQPVKRVQGLRKRKRALYWRDKV